MAIGLRDLLPLVIRIQADPSNDTCLNTLARHVALSPTHLQRIFSRHLGESPKRIANRIALERAAAALTTSPASVLEIALASGFDSHEGFTRAFRRHFSMSPARYRQRGLTGGARATHHKKTVHAVAPCVRLYGTRLHLQPKLESTPMSYTFTKKTLTETPILFMRKRVEHAKVGPTLGELLPKVFAYAMQHGIAFAGPPMCRYTSWSSGGVTLEAGLPVVTPAEAEGDILAGSLPSGPAVSTVHTGPYDTLSEAHSALEAWLSDNALRKTGDSWEVYLTDPGQVPDPAQWLTEIITPASA